MILRTLCIALLTAFATLTSACAPAPHPDVRDVLARHYPNDHATGFDIGDLRGALWVEVPTTGREAPAGDVP